VLISVNWRWTRALLAATDLTDTIVSLDAGLVGSTFAFQLE
jgi:hypothetical protein